MFLISNFLQLKAETKKSLKNDVMIPLFDKKERKKWQIKNRIRKDDRHSDVMMSARKKRNLFQLRAWLELSYSTAFTQHWFWQRISKKNKNIINAQPQDKIKKQRIYCFRLRPHKYKCRWYKETTQRARTNMWKTILQCSVKEPLP